LGISEGGRIGIGYSKGEKMFYNTNIKL